MQTLHVVRVVLKGGVGGGGGGVREEEEGGGGGWGAAWREFLSRPKRYRKKVLMRGKRQHPYF
jgi:hypothetical protein